MTQPCAVSSLLGAGGQGEKVSRRQGLRQLWSMHQRQAEGAAGMAGGALETSLIAQVVPSGACASWVVV